MTARDGFSPALPIDRYRYTIADLHLITDATNLLIHQCMQRLGYSWTVPRVTGPADEMIQRTLDSRRYGLTSLQAARTLGYHWPYPANTPNAEPKLDPAGQLALLGPTAAQARYGAKPGGCAGDALRALGDDGSSALAGRLAAHSFTRSRQDSAVLGAFRSWSRCMSAAGYAYATPLESISDKRWSTPAVTPLERRVATADVRCAQAHRVDSIWRASEVHIEQEDIEAYKSALASEAARHQATLSAARRILG